MDSEKEQFERWHGDRLIEWLNDYSGTAFSFSHRAGEAPDLVYSDGQEELFMEVTAAYYDEAFAKFLWGGARDLDAEIEPWVGLNPDASLVYKIEDRIRVKSAKSYGKNCLLLVVVPPGVTSSEKLEELLAARTIEDSQLSFVGVYVAGCFPVTLDSEGGYRVWPVKAFR